MTLARTLASLFLLIQIVGEIWPRLHLGQISQFEVVGFTVMASAVALEVSSGMKDIATRLLKRGEKSWLVSALSLFDRETNNVRSNRTRNK